MTNLILVLAVLDIVAMTVLVIVHRIPPLYRRLQTALVAQGYWRSTWPSTRTMIPPLLLALVGVLWGLVLLL
ncbi:hypothetical protein LTV02_15095 [Nocardia yamanashiensis]|uniref:hypothetical protein n=1 Tax=Nocardia yamanashiensis TaxID=209247 RepID=UPI001E630858|nr:hypothetical protein [Nocardia yamanashiensis]UGT44631.1 hypothetical protein LTV02_15095 [Nocardia yamanashiensis]